MAPVDGSYLDCLADPRHLPAETSAPEVAEHEEHDQHDDHDRDDVHGVAAFHGDPRKRTCPGRRSSPPGVVARMNPTVRASLLAVMTVRHPPTGSPKLPLLLVTNAGVQCRWP